MKHILATALISLLFTAACGDGGTTESTPDPATPDVPSPVDVNGDLPAAPADVPEDTGPGPDLPPADCVIASDCPATNPCAYAKCIAGVCVDEPHTGTCDDGDGCTVDDACVEGLCLGVPRNCDDNNVCTIDVCSQGVCKHPPDDLPECQMILEVTSPSRGATLTGSSIVVVEGAVATPASPLDTLKVNGSSVSVSLDGTFSHALDATVGINIIEVDATDTAGQSVKRVQAFAWSPELLPPGSPQNVQAVDDASAFYLAPEALDDGDPSDMDDLAGVITELMATFNINDAIPHPLSAETGEPGALWCSWEVDIQNVTYEVESVDITPVLDGLLLYVEMSNVAADVSAVDDGFACPDAIGVVSTPKIMVQSEIEVKVTGGGQLSVIPESVTVIIEEPEVDIQAGAASFFNWLINWFEDDLADLLAVKVEEFVINEAAPLIDGILSSFAHYEMPFDLPSYVPEATGPATIQVAPTDSQITGAGAIFWSDMGIATTQGTPHNAPGQVLRAGCGAGGTESASFPKTSVIEASIHEDLFNQVLFQAWWAGVMETSLPGDAFESELRAWIEDRGPRMPTPEGACWSEATAEVLDLSLTVTRTLTPNSDPSPKP